MVNTPQQLTIPLTTFSKEGSINFKIDWLTIMFYNATIADVFNVLIPEVRLDLDNIDAILRSHYKQNLKGMDDCDVFTFDWFHIYIPKNSVRLTNGEHVIFEKYSNMRVDMSGERLDNIRALGYDINYYVFEPLDVPEDVIYYFTRVDAAYDLLNYQPQFLDECIRFCRENCTDLGAVGIGYRGASKFTVSEGKEKMLRIGSSANILRIYDKRLEQRQKAKFNDCLYRDEFGDLPSSWIRIEWQMRRELANDTFRLEQNGITDGFKLFKLLFNRWGLRKPAPYGCPKKVSDQISETWQNLFDWDRIPAIIQNAKTIHRQVSIIERVKARPVKAPAFFSLTAQAYGGWDNLRDAVNMELQRQASSDNPSDERRYRQYVINSMELAHSAGYDSVENMPNVYIDDGGVIKVK